MNDTTTTPTPHEKRAMTSSTTAVYSENGSGSLANEEEEEQDISDFGNHFMFEPEITVTKCGPSIEVDDNSGEESEGAGIDEQKISSPKIRVTPTFKLMAQPNAVDPKRKFVCPYENCTKSYGKSSHLRSHLTWHSGIKPFLCQEPNCGKGFTRSDELNRHVRTHTGEKPFECVQCTKKFSRSDHLTKHLATHAKQMLNLAAAKNALNNSTRKRKQELERSIERPAAKKSNLKNHNVSEVSHNDVTPVVRTEEVEDLTTEPIYDLTPFKIKLERPENSEEYHVVSTSHSSQGSVTSGQNGNQSTEELNIGGDENEDDAIMPEANAPPLVEDSNELKALTNVFLETAFDVDRPFRCIHCEKCFRRQDDLNRHLRTHTGIKPYACNECDRRFTRSDHLKKHLNTHIKLR